MADFTIGSANDLTEVKPSEEQVKQALAYLERKGALDLSDVLGLAS